MMDSHLPKKFARIWGLWSHYSWRQLAIGGGIVTTTAFLAYCTSNTGQGETYSGMARSTATVLAGFFTSLTVAEFPSIQQCNQIKKNNLSVFMLIGEQLRALEKQYHLDTKSYPVVEHFIHTIKNAARACLNFQLTNETMNTISNLLVINQLMYAINTSLKHFISTLPESLDDFDERVFDEVVLHKAIKFWQQDPLTIKKHLLPEPTLGNDISMTSTI